MSEQNSVRARCQTDTEVASSLAPSTIDQGAPRSHPHAHRSRQRHWRPDFAIGLALSACGAMLLDGQDRRDTEHSQRTDPGAASAQAGR
jgi:hypothetical protein